MNKPKLNRRTLIGLALVVILVPICYVRCEQMRKDNAALRGQVERSNSQIDSIRNR